ncbi:MAG: redoxin domain-containing protein [Candidatus Acidiferrales bacterium]
MLRKMIVGFALIATVAAVCLIVGAKSSAAIWPGISRKAAPSFELADATGAPVKLSGFKGRVVLLNFWATWCHGCQTEIPWFIQFEDKYNESGLTVVGVSMDDDGWKSVKPWIAEKKVNYPIVIGNAQVGKLFDLGAMPKTVLIDRQGNIAATFEGVVDRDACEKEIRSLLHEDAKSAVR